MPALPLHAAPHSHLPSLPTPPLPHIYFWILCPHRRRMFRRVAIRPHKETANKQPSLVKKKIRNTGRMVLAEKKRVWRGEPVIVWQEGRRPIQEPIFPWPIQILKAVVMGVLRRLHFFGQENSKSAIAKEISTLWRGDRDRAVGAGLRARWKWHNSTVLCRCSCRGWSCPGNVFTRTSGR